MAAINQYLVEQRREKKKYQVLISGQGADELFYGYLKYNSFYLINLLKNKKFIKFLKNFLYLFKNNFFRQIKIYNVLRYLNFNLFNKNKFLKKNY